MSNTEMNTTHTNEPTEPNAKSMEGRLLETISLRDYFAANAMHAALMTARPAPHESVEDVIFASAEAAYQAADAMLKARQA
jgi:hypothetical protein